MNCMKAEILQENSEKNTISPLNIKFHKVQKEELDFYTNPISITQKSSPQKDVNCRSFYNRQKISKN